MLVTSAITAGLVLLASWVAASLARRRAAAARHHIWALGVAGALAMPVLCAFAPPVPSWAMTALGDGEILVARAVVVSAAPAASSLSWLAVAWGVGTLLVALRFVGGHLAARRLWRAAEPASRWSALLREAAASLAVTGRVGLGRSASIRSPMTLGIWWPRVLLPAAADAWSEERMRAILVHELGHVRRRDTLVQLGAQLACAMYWWNPLAWLAAARLRTEREHACDDLVLALGTRPSSYAADLLEVARGVAAQPAWGGAAHMVDASGTAARIRRVLDPSAPRRPPGVGFRLAARGATLALAATLACTSAPRPVAAPATPPMKVGSPVLDTNGFTGWLAGSAQFDLALVAKAMEPARADLDRCYQRRLAARPGLKGAVVMRLTVSPVGVFTRGVSQDTVGDAEVLSCVQTAIEHARFASPVSASVDLVVPFLFGGASLPGC